MPDTEYRAMIALLQLLRSTAEGQLTEAQSGERAMKVAGYFCALQDVEERLRTAGLANDW